MSRTTIFIDDDLLKEAMKVTGAKSKREAVEKGLRELVRRRRLEALRKELGTFEINLSLHELEKLRGED